MRAFKLLIDGELVAGAGSLEVINPATGHVLQLAPKANREQLDAAVAAAKMAFPAWAQTGPDERRSTLLQLAAALEARLAEFAELLTREQGKPLTQAQGEVFFCVYTLRVFARMDLSPRIVKETEQARFVEHYKPLGVAVAITPWNFPLLMLINKLAPALLAGNTLVVKPAPTTPLATLLFGELCHECLPAGVVNILVDDNDLGDLLTSHPDVAKVSFTGSTATGKRVLSNATSTLKRVTLELGGNDAALVLDDVDVAAVAAQIFHSATYNAGQVCVAVKRVYVPEALAEAFCQQLVTLANSAVVGDGLGNGTQIGPLQNQRQFDKVTALLDQTRREGRLMAGGKIVDGPGFFITPAIVTEVTDDARIVAEEQFAPILPVLTYRDLDEAITRINATDFGLGASVWSRDPQRATAVAQRLEAGTVWVNSHIALDPEVPFSGAKQSGLGVALGVEGLRAFTQSSVIVTPKI